MIFNIKVILAIQFIKEKYSFNVGSFPLNVAGMQIVKLWENIVQIK